MNDRYRERNDLISERRREGFTLREIADEFDLTQERVRGILKDHYPDVTSDLAKASRKTLAQRRLASEFAELLDNDTSTLDVLDALASRGLVLVLRDGASDAYFDEIGMAAR